VTGRSFLIWASTLLPFALEYFPFLLADLKLPVETVNGHERGLLYGLHAGSESSPLLAKVIGIPFKDLGEFIQDIQENVPVGCRESRSGDHPICANRPMKEGDEMRARRRKKEAARKSRGS